MFESKSINEIKIGDKASATVEITAERIEAFADATGDFNPIHMDEEYASNSVFKKRVAHGVLLTGIVSGILGTKLPGLGTVAREMDAKFSRPAFIGDTVTAEIELVEKKEKYNICVFKYKVTNQESKVIVKGRAVVLPRKEG